jgi:hypothetical protein
MKFIPSCFGTGLLMLVLVMSGCASAPNVNMDKTAAARIKRVAVLAIPEPPQIQVANLGGGASAFGLIGGLVQGANNEQRAKEFTAQVRQQKLSVSEPLLAALERELKNDGFEVIIERTQKPKLAADGKSDDFSEIRIDADAFVTTWFGTAGYVSQPFSTKYEPWVLVKVRLLDAQTKKDLYFKTFVVGWKMKIDNVVYLPADPKYKYGSFDAVMSHVPEAMAGLEDCSRLIAKQVGRDLSAGQ